MVPDAAHADDKISHTIPSKIPGPNAVLFICVVREKKDKHYDC